MLTIVIQAGGNSRRMGQDKALMPFLGEPLIQRVVRRLAPIADEMLVTTKRPDVYQFLGLPLLSDIIPDRGALGGLHTALISASHPVVAVVACDMPFANAPMLEYACNLLVKDEVDVVIPRSEQGFEPLHAIYRKETCLPAIEAAIGAEQWKLISWFPQVRVNSISPETAAAFDPLGLAFLNLNTPEELADAEQLARKVDV
jgi:molybdenum cofactor guanylyltransferase